jgi:hypothetical protein
MLGPINGAAAYGRTDPLQASRQRQEQAKKEAAAQGQENLRNAARDTTAQTGSPSGGSRVLQASRARQEAARQETAAQAGANLGAAGSTASADDTRKRLEATATKLEKDLAGANSAADRGRIQESLDKVRGSLNSASGTQGISDRLGARLRQAGGTTESATEKAGGNDATKPAVLENKDKMDTPRNSTASTTDTRQAETEATIEKLAQANQRQRTTNANRFTAAYERPNQAASSISFNA